MTTNPNLTALSEAGVSIWLDDLSRGRINSGNLAELIEKQAVVGVTSNPTIFAKALSNAADYNDKVRELAARGASVDEAVRELITSDVRDAADVFRNVYESTGKVDGRVSLEVDPRLAHDTEGTVAEALDLWKTVDRPNLMVKIPATVEGLPAITRALAEGVSVNVTLIFSVERYREVMDAFLTGLERAKENGKDLSEIFSVASFFVSRVDTEIDKRLEKVEGGEQLRGKAAIANARLAYAAYQEVFSSPLEGAGGRRRQPAAAAVGFLRCEGPGLLGHPLRGRAGGAEHGEHHAGGHAAGGRRPRERPRGHGERHRCAGPAGVRRPEQGRHRRRRRLRGAGARRCREVREVLAGAA